MNISSKKLAVVLCGMGGPSQGRMGWGGGHSKARGKAIKGCVPTRSQLPGPASCHPAMGWPESHGAKRCQCAASLAAVSIGQIAASVCGEGSCSSQTRWEAVWWSPTCLHTFRRRLQARCDDNYVNSELWTGENHENPTASLCLVLFWTPMGCWGVLRKRGEEIEEFDNEVTISPPSKQLFELTMIWELRSISEITVF
jgi:hypothetical protein